MSGYTPIFNSVFDGSLAGKWPDSAVWLTMLALCDKHGHVNMTPAAIAARTGWPVDLLRQGIEALMQPDPESQSREEEGRRLILLDPARSWGWRVVNHSKYREKARLHSKDSQRVESGLDAERKRKSRDNPVSPGVPRYPPVSPSSDSDSSDSVLRTGESAVVESSTEESLDKALFSESRKIFGKSCGGLINRAIRAQGKPWVVDLIERCKRMDSEQALAYLNGALRKQQNGRGFVA